MTLTQVAGLLGRPNDRGPRYLPILKARQGELRALEFLHDPMSGGVMPLPEDVMPVVELVEVDFNGLTPGEVGDQAQKLVTKLVRAWPAGRPRIVVDATGIEVDTEVPSWGHHGEPLMPEPVTPLILRMLHDAGVPAVPVVRLSDQDAVVEHLRAQLGQSRERGACLRIGGEDLDDALVPLDESVAQLLERYALEAADVDLLLDFGPVESDHDLGMAARLARFVLPMLARANWRTFAIGSGAFPVNLGDVAAYSIAEVPRYDQRLWTQLNGMQLAQQLDYADYAVTHPLLQTGVAFAAPPQIRYAAQGRWLVMKGRRTDRRGHKQFFDLCGRLRAEYPADISPEEFSWGDVRFHEAADQAGKEPDRPGPGNASTWRAIATSHHIGYVLQALSTRNEP